MSTPSDRSDAATSAEAGSVAATGPDPQSVRPSARPGGPESLVGVLISGRYRIERLIGEGGMGAVYQAEHTHMRKRLAVKVLHPEMSRLPEMVTRFEREAMAAAHIEHPNVAAATDFGRLEDGSFFLVLEYVEGRTLREVIAEGPLDLGRALHIARQVASALGRAHAIGIVHRDLKPENVMLVTRNGEADFVKVLDFGIAKVPVGELWDGHRAAGQALTQVGMVYGTPEYMAPEQALGQPVDARADLYGLGVILFEMIAGARPYEHASKVTLLGMHVTAPVPRLSARAPAANVPASVDAVVTRLLAKEATARFVDAKELIDVLDMATGELCAVGRIDHPAVPMASLVHSARRSPPGLAGHVATPHWSAARLGGAFAQAFRTGSTWVLSWSPRWFFAFAAPAVALIVLASALRGGRPTQTAADSGRTSGSAVAPFAAPPLDAKVDETVAAAQASIDKGDFAAAIARLSSVERGSPDRADVHWLLERGYTGVRAGRDAMREARLLLGLDAKTASDPKLDEDIRSAALAKDTQEDALALLEDKMGSRGVDILYDMAFGATARLYPQAASRAKRSLSSDDVRTRASPATRLLLEFREARSCEARHALLDGARDHADVRLLPTLEAYRHPRGCGFLGVADCYPCMRKDASLAETIAAIAERGGAKGP